MPQEPLCDICSTRRAGLRMTALRVGRLGGRTYVCARCAQEGRLLKTDGGFDLAALVYHAAERLTAHSSRMGCPVCGTSLAEVVTGGRMGCAACYDRFSSEVDLALVSIHGSAVHRGKAPERRT